MKITSTEQIYDYINQSQASFSEILEELEKNSFLSYDIKQFLIENIKELKEWKGNKNIDNLETIIPKSNMRKKEYDNYLKEYIKSFYDYDTTKNKKRSIYLSNNIKFLDKYIDNLPIPHIKQALPTIIALYDFLFNHYPKILFEILLYDVNISLLKKQTLKNLRTQPIYDTIIEDGVKEKIKIGELETENDETDSEFFDIFYRKEKLNNKKLKDLIFSKPDNLLLIYFMGHPTANFFSCVKLCTYVVEYGILSYDFWKFKELPDSYARIDSGKSFSLIGAFTHLLDDLESFIDINEGSYSDILDVDDEFRYGFERSSFTISQYEQTTFIDEKEKTGYFWFLQDNPFIFFLQEFNSGQVNYFHLKYSFDLDFIKERTNKIVGYYLEHTFYNPNTEKAKYLLSTFLKAFPTEEKEELYDWLISNSKKNIIKLITQKGFINFEINGLLFAPFKYTKEEFVSNDLSQLVKLDDLFDFSVFHYYLIDKYGYTIEPYRKNFNSSFIRDGKVLEQPTFRAICNVIPDIIFGFSCQTANQIDNIVNYYCDYLINKNWELGKELYYHGRESVNDIIDYSAQEFIFASLFSGRTNLNKYLNDLVYNMNENDEDTSIIIKEFENCITWYHENSCIDDPILRMFSVLNEDEILKNIEATVTKFKIALAKEIEQTQKVFKSNINNIVSLDIDRQIKYIQDTGIKIDNIQYCKEFLNKNGIYRISLYWLEDNKSEYKTLDQYIEIFMLDKQLRNILSDLLEYIEKTVKFKYCNYFEPKNTSKKANILMSNDENYFDLKKLSKSIETISKWNSAGKAVFKEKTWSFIDKTTFGNIQHIIAAMKDDKVSDFAVNQYSFQERDNDSDVAFSINTSIENAVNLRNMIHHFNKLYKQLPKKSNSSDNKQDKHYFENVDCQYIYYHIVYLILLVENDFEFEKFIDEIYNFERNNPIIDLNKDYGFSKDWEQQLRRVRNNR